MGQVRLFNIIDLKKLVLSDTFMTDTFAFPYLCGGKIMDLEYFALRTTGDPRQPYLRLAPATYSLSIGVFATDGTQYAFQNDAGFTNDGATNRKYGQLSLSNATISALWAPGVMEVNAFFVIDVDTGQGADETYRISTTLKKPLITAAAVVAPAGEIAATQSWVKAFFRRKNSPAEHWIDRDDAGNAYEVFRGTDGQEQTTPLLTAPPANP